jgi:hypothetical protein
MLRSFEYFKLYRKYYYTICIYRDVMVESRNSGAKARRPLLSNDSEITFPLQRIAANESLPDNKLLNTRFLCTANRKTEDK